MGLIAAYHKYSRRRIEGKGEGGIKPTPLHLLSNDSGFSLLEMMIADIILLISILGLFSLTTKSMEVNNRNEIRNTGIRITTQVAEIILAQPFDNIVSGGLSPYNNSNPALTPDFRQYPNPDQTIRGFTQLYNVTWNVIALTNDLREIQISVLSTYLGQQYSNNAVVYKHRKT